MRSCMANYPTNESFPQASVVAGASGRPTYHESQGSRRYGAGREHVPIALRECLSISAAPPAHSAPVKISMICKRLENWMSRGITSKIMFIDRLELLHDLAHLCRHLSLLERLLQKASGSRGRSYRTAPQTCMKDISKRGAVQGPR